MIYIKTPQEIEKIKAACQIISDMFKFVEEKIRVGVTTKEIDKFCFDYIASRGAKPNFLGYYGFPGTICTSIDEEVVHGFPSDRVLEEGQIVSIDTGCVLNGYHADAARTFPVGKCSAEKLKLVEVTKECFFKGVEAVSIGGALGDVGYAIQQHAESNGFSVVRDMVGHGIGKSLHEDPQVPNYGKRGVGVRLRKGMTLCIEPMINMGDYHVEIDGWRCVTADGLPSAHYENTIAITDDGVQILTL